jgi:hypothetical protein
MKEESLEGGYTNTVVRVGHTVRRSAGAWTPTIHRLLSHARGRGVMWVPEPLGYDEVGREMLSFVPGEVPHDMPAWVWSDDVLMGVARALRQWHDATADFDAAHAIWNLDAHEPHEVICHNDFAPYNCVFRERRFAGAIDFDLCSPGPRLWDMVYTAYRFVPLMPPVDADVADGAQERSPFQLSRMRARLAAFLAAYAAGDAHTHHAHDVVIDTAVRRLAAIAAWTESHSAKTGALENHGRMYRAHAQWLTGHFVAG